MTYNGLKMLLTKTLTGLLLIEVTLPTTKTVIYKFLFKHYVSILFT